MLKIRSLCILHPEMSIYRRDFNKTKCMYFLIKEEKAFNKYNEILGKVSNMIKKQFINKLVYNKKHLKAGKKTFIVFIYQYY